MSQIAGCSTCAGPQEQIQQLLNSYRQKSVPGSEGIGTQEGATDPRLQPPPTEVAAVAETDTRQAPSAGDIQSIFRQLGEGTRSVLIGVQSEAGNGARANNPAAESDRASAAAAEEVEPFEDLAQAPAPDDGDGPRLLTEAIVDHQRATQSYYANLGGAVSPRGLGLIA